MVSIPVLVSELLRLGIRPSVIGPLALAMVIFREVGPPWRASFLRLFYDLTLVLLAIVLVVVLALALAQAPTV
jgi:hypothetical protein